MSYVVEKTKLDGVLIITPEIYIDNRGFFYESFNLKEFRRSTGVDLDFIQDNHSYSNKGVLRGLHYQISHAQGKLVRVIQGAVFDVVVDLRCGSKTFGEWIGIKISSTDRRQLWIPPGFAPGYLVLSDSAEIVYKTTEYWYPEFERSLLWCDLDLSIKWPMCGDPILSEKDACGYSFANAEKYL